MLKSETININDARYLLGSQVQPAYSKTEFEGGLLVPFGSDDTFLLSVVEGDAILSNTNLSGLGAFSQNKKQSIMAILDLRESAEILEKELLVSTFSEAKPELPSLTPPAAVLPD